MAKVTMRCQSLKETVALPPPGTGDVTLSDNRWSRRYLASRERRGARRRPGSAPRSSRWRGVATCAAVGLLSAAAVVAAVYTLRGARP